MKGYEAAFNKTKERIFHMIYGPLVQQYLLPDPYVKGKYYVNPIYYYDVQQLSKASWEAAEIYADDFLKELEDKYLAVLDYFCFLFCDSN